jgi:uncharacterized coiled-coil DUF342 family protein
MRFLKNALLLCFAAVVGTTLGCSSDSDERATERDRDGHYASTSQYRSMERAPFLRSMRAALDDHDQRVKELERRAKELGNEKVETLAEYTPTLAANRDALKNRVMQVEQSLDKDYEDRREECYDAFLQLRESLDEASEAVLGN